jgi:hypothetical protein
MARAKLGKVRAGTGPSRTLATLTLCERSGHDRTNEVVLCTIPLAETDNIKSIANLGIFQSGTSIPAQFRVLSRWWGAYTDATKPISSVQVAFTCASLAANAVDATTYTLRTPGAGNTGIGITVTDNTTSWDINTGAITARVRQVAGGAHNLFDLVTTASGKNFFSAGNASGLYLHGVDDSSDAVTAISTSDDITGNLAAMNTKTLIVSYNGGANQTVTFAAGESTVALVLTKINATGTSSTWKAQNKDTTNKSIRLTCRNASDTLTIRSTGTANADLGFSAVSDTVAAHRDNSQDADYSSNAYLPGDSNYTTEIEWQGSEVVVVKVVGKFGTSGSEFQGMNDESTMQLTESNNTWIVPADMHYESRYTFFKNSNYIAHDVLWKGGGASSQGYWLADAAIKHGGIAVALNYSGAGTQLATYDPGDSADDYATAFAYVSGSPYVYQDFSPSAGGYGFTVGKSWTDYLGGSGHTFDEPWCVVQQSASDRHCVGMCYRTSKEVVPQGFKYDGTKLLIQPWVEERGEINPGFTTRPYHIFPGNRYYRWRGGLLFGDGAASIPTVRAQWAKFCRHPIIVHCQDKYETSKLYGDVGLAPNKCYHDAQGYQATVSHVATAATEPGVGADWEDVWETDASTYGVPWHVGDRFTSFEMPNPDADGLLEEARHRWVKWKYAMIDYTVTAAADQEDLQAQYDRRNASAATPTVGQYTCYGWHRYGCAPRQAGCHSNHYDHVMRLVRAWFVTGNPEFYEWADRMADHMAWVCTSHWAGQSGGNGLAFRSSQYGETGNAETAIHGHGDGAVSASVINVQYRTYWYALTGYTPLKELSQRWVDGFAGYITTQYNTVMSSDGAPVAGNGGTQTRVSRDFSWPMDGLMHHYRITGDTTALTYAGRIWRRTLLYSHDLIGNGKTIQDENGGTDSGGMGYIANAVAGQGTDGAPHNHGTITYIVYPLDPIKNFIEWGEASRQKGGQTLITTTDLAGGRRWLRQAMKALLTGQDEVSPNKALNLANWTSMVRPLYRGGYKGGVDGGSIAAGSSNLMSMQFYQPCGAARYSSGLDMRVIDAGVAPRLSTTIDSCTATVSGTSVTLSSAPTNIPDLTHSWFWVDADGATLGKKITVHSGTSITLASSYAGTTGAGLSFTVSLAGTQAVEHLGNMLDAGVFALEWYKANGMMTQYNALKPVLRRAFEQSLLYGLTTDSSWYRWDATFATTSRASIMAGYSVGDARERIQGWYNRNACNRYLAAERDGVF